MPAQFLKLLYGTTNQGWLTLWTRQDRITRWHSVIDTGPAIKEVLSLTDEKKDVYFGVGIRKEKLEPYKTADGKTVIPRGSAEDVISIPGVWIDVDVANEKAHAKQNLPLSFKDAVNFLHEFPLKPSVVVNSGHGLHAYWLFAEPWEFETSKEREEAQDFLRRFQLTIIERAREREWDLDTTSDLARVLRIPGTKNFKDKPVPVEMLSVNVDIRYSPDDFEEYLIDLEEYKPSPAKKKEEAGTGPASLMLNNCAYMQYCKKHADRLSEPEWYAMITNVARADDGPEMCHKLSKSYPRYNPAETDKKIKHALTKGHPHTCHHIQVDLGFNECPEQGCDVAAPIGLVSSPVVKARLVVELIPEKMKIDVQSIYEEETIGALAVLRQNYPNEYAQAKGTIKEIGGRNISLTELERAVKHQQIKNSRLRLVRGSGNESAIGEVPEGLMYEPRRPPGWTIDQQGIYFNTEKGPVIASPVPVLITKRLRHVDTGAEKIELAYHRDKKWRYIVANRSTVFTRTRLPELSDKGLPVTSETAKNLINYLSELEFVNIADIPLVRAVSRMGWVNSREFLPGCSDVLLDVDGGTMHYANAFQPAGTLEAWVNFVKPLREYPVGRLILSAGFAAPLIEVLNQRIFLLHIWGGTRGGKSAACKAAGSIWGNPEEAQVTFHGTRVGLEQQAAFLSNLPMVIDEKQVLSGNRQDFLESLVYMLGMGKGKARGAKGGGLQEFKTWKTLIITNGEHPITTASSVTGIKTRTVEIYSRAVIPDEKYSQMMHARLNVLHGTAGPKFIKNLIEYEGDVQKDYESLIEKLQAAAPGLISSHFGAMAIIGLADYLSSIWIFGLDPDTAIDEMINMYAQILKQMESAEEAEEAYRALNFLRSWTAQHRSMFHDGERERFGWIDAGLYEQSEEDANLSNQETVFFFPTAFSKAMKDGGFNERRILQDFADLGWIDCTTEGGKRRYSVKRKHSLLGINRVIVLLPTDDVIT